MHDDLSNIHKLCKNDTHPDNKPKPEPRLEFRWHRNTGVRLDQYTKCQNDNKSQSIFTDYLGELIP